MRSADGFARERHFASSRSPFIADSSRWAESKANRTRTRSHRSVEAASHFPPLQLSPSLQSPSARQAPGAGFADGVGAGAGSAAFAFAPSMTVSPPLAVF